MNLHTLIEKSRSYRRFEESYRVESETLISLVDLARLSPSSANRQPLKYILISKLSESEAVFPLLRWAGYLEEWNGPAPGERPSAYIIILGDQLVHKSFSVDHGIAAQSIMLGATEAGLGGCIIASVARNELRALLKIEERYEILLVLALGKPAEKVVIDTVRENDIKYWRDEQDVHHVPKRSLDDLIIVR